MFIKIKLEPQSSKAFTLLKISYFSIDDDATIINLKSKIEEYVDVPTERQEIRTLVGVFQNSWYVKEVCDVRGSAIMLYAYDELKEFEEPQFVCFLQVYTNDLAAQQQDLEQRSKLFDNKITTPTSSTSSVTLIASSDTDSEETDSETSSSKSTASDLESGCSTENSHSSYGQKRGKHQKKCPIQNKKLKVNARSVNQYPETLCQYLDEFPKFSKELKLTSDNKQDSNKCQNIETNSNDFNSLYKSAENENPNENRKELQENTNNTQTFLEGKHAKANSVKIQSNIVTTTNLKKNNIIHPCYSINPDIRDYLAIICSKDANTISSDECEELLVWFFDRFRACTSSNNLQFDSQTAISHFDGKLWIACMNLNTFEWISANILKYSLKSYKILSLNDSKHLCEVVVPVVSKSKHVLDIFDLLEKQNKNITTLKWSLQNRQSLLSEDKDFTEKAISTFCTNEVYIIAVDAESRKYLEKINFKLKYCFWQIVFKFV